MQFFQPRCYIHNQRLSDAMPHPRRVHEEVFELGDAIGDLRYLAKPTTASASPTATLILPSRTPLSESMSHSGAVWSGFPILQGCPERRIGGTPRHHGAIGRRAPRADRIVRSMDDRTPASVPQVQQHLAYRTLVSAFTDDPVERWLYPELPSYLARFPRLLVAFGGRAFDEQTVWGLGKWSAVALWLPPAAEPDGDAMSPCSARRSHQTSTMTRSPLLNRWTPPIPRFPIGISHGLALTQPSRGGAWVAR